MIGKAAKFVGHKILNGLGHVGEGVGKAGYSLVKSTLKGDFHYDGKIRTGADDNRRT